MQHVLHLVSAQLTALKRGIRVLDLTRARPNLQVAIDEKEQFMQTSSNLRVPVRFIVPRIANSLGDAVEQAVVAGHRTIKSIFFCRCCFTNQPGAGYEGTVYKFRQEILEYDISMCLYRTCTCSIKLYYHYVKFYVGRDAEQTNIIRNSLKRMFASAPTKLEEYTRACGIEPDVDVNDQAPLDHPFYRGMRKESHIWIPSGF